MARAFFDVSAASVGCGHVSGLLMRRVWPLTLMLCADQVMERSPKQTTPKKNDRQHGGPSIPQKVSVTGPH